MQTTTLAPHPLLRTPRTGPHRARHASTRLTPPSTATAWESSAGAFAVPRTRHPARTARDVPAMERPRPATSCKGQKALTLCHAVTVKRQQREQTDTNDAATFTRFIYRPRWFVLAQTDGDRLPTPRRRPTGTRRKPSPRSTSPKSPLTHSTATVKGSPGSGPSPCPLSPRCRSRRCSTSSHTSCSATPPRPN